MNAFLFSGALTLALAVPLSGQAWEFKAASDLNDWSIVNRTEWDEPIFSKLAVNTKTDQLDVVVEHGTWYNSMTGGLMIRHPIVDCKSTRKSSSVYAAFEVKRSMDGAADGSHRHQGRQAVARGRRQLVVRRRPRIR